MDYTEQFIRLNCSLMSDYKMMKLNADMKCMGLGLYLETILFLRKQQEYKHDFNELDLLADQWGATVENLQHLIKDFDLFLITEDGYFRCLYLDEVMGYQSKLSEQRAAAGSKGGRSSKKSTVKASAKATASTASAIGRGRINEGKNGDASCMDNNKEVYMKSSGAPSMDSKERIYMESSNVDSDKVVCMDNSKPIHSDYNKEIYKENSTESNVKSSAESMKNTTAKNTNGNSVKNVIQSVDNERYGKGLQASFKQNFIREEKNREEKKKKDDVNIIQRNIDVDGKIAVVAELFRNIEFTPRWKRYINEAFPVRTQAATARMMSVLEERGIGPPKKNYASHGLLRVIDH